MSRFFFSIQGNKSSCIWKDESECVEKNEIISYADENKNLKWGHAAGKKTYFNACHLMYI